MGMRFRRSVKIAPGVRLNFNKNSVGISAGVPGARVSVNSNGRKTKTVGVPGTGLYYTESSGGGHKSSSPPPAAQVSSAPTSFAVTSIGSFQLPTIAGVDAALSRRKKNMYIWSIVLAIVGISLLSMGSIGILEGIICFVGMAWLIISSRKKLATLNQSKDLIYPVQAEIASLRDNYDNLAAAADAIQFFVAYDHLSDSINTLNLKSPAFFESADTTADALLHQLTAAKIDKYIDDAYATATKGMMSLKTRAGMEGRISRFTTTFASNDAKLNNNQRAKVRAYTDDLNKALSMSFPED